MRLNDGESQKIWKIANYVSRHGAGMGRGDDRVMTLCNIEFQFTARYQENRRILHSLLTPEWLVRWRPAHQYQNTLITDKTYGAMIRDVTLVLLSGELDA